MPGVALGFVKSRQRFWKEVPVALKRNPLDHELEVSRISLYQGPAPPMVIPHEC